jgi:replicative DNA helicase
MAQTIELPGKVPPQSLEAERAVLGAILLEPPLLPRAIELLISDDFYKDSHRRIFDAMVKLFERGDTPDVITVMEELRRQGIFDQVGGLAALATLQEEGTVATQFSAYCRIVREKALLREMIRAAHEIVEEGYEETDDVQVLLDRAEQRLFRISQRRFQRSAMPVKEMVSQAIHHIEALYQRKEDITGLATGFADLDKLTSGLQRADFVIIAGRPSTGKTAFALNIAAHAAVKLQRPVLLFSLEMSGDQLVQRLLCAEARVGSQKVRSGYMEAAEWRRINEAAGRVYEAPMLIDDTANLSALEVRAKARRVKAEHGLDLIVVDYLQLMQGRTRAENRQQEISEISRSLKALAKELNVPVVALSQLSRAVEARGDTLPRLSDLRESGALEQDADLIMFLARKEASPEMEVGTTEIVIGKHRNGPTGRLELVFNAAYTRFDDLASLARRDRL